MITGAHFLIYSRDADADRAFLQRTFQFNAVDAGGGWLIFGLPPSELAVHPTDESFTHPHADVELLGCLMYLMCEDIDDEVARLRGLGVACSEKQAAEWGIATTVPLPSGGRIGLYQPRHASPLV